MLQTLEEENSNSLIWSGWTPNALKSKKSEELQITNSNTNEADDESFSLEDKEVLAQSYKENCNPAVTYNSQRPNLKHKKSKHLKVNATKRNERYYELAQSKLELVEILKENNDKKTVLEISILELQLEKEKLHVEILKKQLTSYGKK